MKTKRMGKGKTKATVEKEYSFLDEVRKKAPQLYDKAASLQPFDDVIQSQWVEDGIVGIEVSSDGIGCAYPSGIYHTYGAHIHADRVRMWCDTYMKDGDCLREMYDTDMAGLWSYLRQLPRPMHTFGKWVREW